MSIYDKLNEPQREAVYHTDGPLLILAGAGSGKTRVLTHRIAYLIEERNVNPWNILAITFTNKAAGEMRERVDSLVGFGSESIWVSTFHSMCVRILRRFIDRLGYDNRFTIYDTDDQKTLMKEVCKKVAIDTKVFKERSLMSAISSAKNELILPDEFELNAGGDFAKLKIAKVYREYEAQLKANNALDFDDLLVKAVQLLQTQPDVLENYQERFRYIMVDEYQDTNTVQFQLVRLLAGKYRNLCVVGDDDQSIYKFRGANIRNILDFEHEFSDACVIKLEQNYRSTGNILNAANRVIANNKGRKEKTLWTANGEGELVHLRQFDTGYDEADFIAEDIKKEVRAGASYNDHAVLYRTNAQSRLLEEKFVAMNVPYKIVGGVNFYARREIKDLLAYLKTIDNGMDDIAVRRIINVPKRGIGLTTINRIQESAAERGLGFYETLMAPELIPGIGRSAAKLDSFAALIEYFKGLTGQMSITDLLREVIEKTGYMESLDSEDKEDAQARKENIDELINKAAAYEEAAEDRDEPATLSAFLEEVALVADIDSLDEEQDYVVLMTLHSAKGLEFPHVYLAGMEDGLFPSYMTITSDDRDDLEEERRLCYVGITRAEQELTLTCARRRMVRGETQYNKISRFIKEIPAELLDTGSRRIEPETEVPVQQNTYAHAREAFRARAFGAAYSNGAGKSSGVSSGKSSQGLASLQKGSQLAAGSGGSPDYAEGDRVRHVKFGEGTVLEIRSGGRDYEVTVDFDSAGVRKMFAKFAKLVKIS
ncbi:DNA helicase PcrA [[Ruminococcus] lactaris]|uniref:DNA helicase PcrA n=1 Tax=[Ruminococcus] lactaris TaxID=46228 RepID=UPI0023B12635|nr:DNA helicase PcrA [[Ruminococcus] lactaris]MDE8700241.1 DNA helicase PcrA [[Ruminococcus] lactaris]